MKQIAGTARNGITSIPQGVGVTLSPPPTGSLAASLWPPATTVGQVQSGTACQEARFLVSSAAFFRIRRALSYGPPAIAAGHLHFSAFAIASRQFCLKKIN